MIEFQDGHFHDGAAPITLEDSMRLTGAYAGIHDYDFQDLILEPFDDLDDWTTDGAGTFTISSGQFSLTGAGDARLYRAWHDIDVEPSFVASFDLISGEGYVPFLGNVGGTAIAAWWTSSACGFSYIAYTGVETVLVSIPKGISAPARIQLAAKYVIDINGRIKWLHATLFADGECIVGFTKDIAPWSWLDVRLGFAVSDSNNMVVDNLTVSSFSRIVEWTTIDTGDNPASGMSRSVGTTRLARQARFNGVVRIWRPGNRDSDWTLPEHRPVKAAYRHEKIGVVTHVRTRGVLYQVDVFDDSQGIVHQHRFVQTDDPNIYSKEATRAEALKVLHDETEKQTELQLEAPPNPALEPHDRIEYNGSSWRVKGIQRGIVVSGQAVVPKSTINAQRYIASD